MGERAEQSAPAVHMQITGGPNGGCAYVAGKHGVFCCQLIEDPGHILRMNGRSAWLADRELIQTLAGVLVVTQAGVEIGAIGLALEHRGQHLERVLHISNQTQIHGGATANLLPEAVHLNDLCTFRVELLVGKICAQHEERIAIHHGVVAGGKAEQTRHPYIVRVVVLDEFLGSHGVHNWRFQALGRRQEFLVSTGTARAAEYGDLARAVKNGGGLAQLVLRGENHGCGVFDPERKRVRGTLTQRHISGDHNDCNPTPGNRCAHGDSKDTRHLVRLGNQFAIVTAIFE